MLNKILEDEDPNAPSSRNLYGVVVTTLRNLLPVDINGSPGLFKTLAPNGTIYYIKVVGCSLTLQDSTTTIDGAGRNIDNDKEPESAPPHVWSTAEPLASRGRPYEDNFSALFGRAAAPPVEVGGPRNAMTHIQQSIFEKGLSQVMILSPTLSMLEGVTQMITGLSYAALPERYGFLNVTE